MEKKKVNFTLVRKDGACHLLFDGQENGVPVKIILARPLSGQNMEIVFTAKDKKSIAMISDITLLDKDSQEIVHEALRMRYLIATIVKVDKTKTHFGTRYWEVTTDRGKRTFAMKDPNRNVIRINDDRIVLQDTHGNLFRINSLSEMDKQSLAQIEKVI